MKKSKKIGKSLEASRHVYKAMEYYISGQDSDGDWEVKCALSKLSEIEESEDFTK